MGRLWQAGPHLASVAAETEFTFLTGTVAISTTTTRVGPQSLRTNPAATMAYARHTVLASDTTGVCWFRTYVNFASLPSGDATVKRIVDSSNNPSAQLRYINSTHALVLINAAGTQVGSASPALSTGTWYRIELGLDSTSSPGTIAARLNGTPFSSGANSSQRPWSRVLAGTITATTMDAFWTDFAVNDGTGTAQTGPPGDSAVIAALPSGAGDANGWSNTANAAGSATNWALVDEVPPDDATTMVQTGTLNAEDMYAVTPVAPVSGTVNVVMVGARLRNNTADAAAAVKFQLKKASGGTVTQSAAVVPNSTNWRTNTPAVPRTYPIIAHLDPDGAPWTPATVASAQIGHKLTATGTQRVQVSTVWMTVDVSPTSTVTAETLAASVSAPGAAASTTVAASPSTAATAAAAAAAAVQAAAELGPAAAAASTAVPAAALAADSTAPPATAAGAASLPAPAAAADSSASAAPAAATATSQTPPPSPAADASTAPDTLPASAPAPAPAVMVEAAAAALVGPVAAAAAAPSASVSATSTTRPATATAATSAPPTVLQTGISATVPVQPAAAQTTAPDPDPSTGSTAAAAPAHAAVSVPSPAAAGTSDTSPAALPAAATAAIPPASLPAAVSPPPAPATITVAAAAALSTGTTAAPLPPALAAVLPPPLAGTSKAAQPPGLATAAAAPAGAVATTATATVAHFTILTAVPQASVAAEAPDRPPLDLAAGPASTGWAASDAGQGWSTGAAATGW